MLSVAEVLECAGGAGFGAVGIDGFTAGDCEPPRLAELLVRSGLRCSEVGVLTVERTRNLSRCGLVTEMARATGATLCVTTSNIEPGHDLIRELAICAGVLAEAGVRLALEFLPYSPLATLAEAIETCAAVGWERCGVLLDSWHFFNSGAPWDALKRLSGDDIALVQVNDAPPPIGTDLQFESRFRRVLPGTGLFDIQRFVSAVVATGFSGPISPEVLSISLIQQHPPTAALSLMQSLQRVWPLPSV